MLSADGDRYWAELKVHLLTTQFTSLLPAPRHKIPLIPWDHQQPQLYVPGVEAQGTFPFHLSLHLRVIQLQLLIYFMGFGLDVTSQLLPRHFLPEKNQPNSSPGTPRFAHQVVAGVRLRRPEHAPSWGRPETWSFFCWFLGRYRSSRIVERGWEKMISILCVQLQLRIHMHIMYII